MGSSIAAACLTLLACMAVRPVHAQRMPTDFRMAKTAAVAEDDRPLSNSAVEFLVKSDSLWVAGGKGLDLTVNQGVSWTHFGDRTPFDFEDIAAMASHGNDIWVSLAGSYDTGEGTLPQGLGLVHSTDNGTTWTRINQPRESEDKSVVELQYGDNTIRALAITTDINNITYDIAVTSRAIFIASFAGGLRKSTDGGQTFTPVILPPDFLDTISPDDTLDFELSPVSRPDLGLRESLNHRVFSVHASSDDEIWVGTAGGINQSTDGGVSWRKYSYNNQLVPISGNFVVAIDENVIANRRVLWASTINATDPTEYRAVSYTTDDGATWTTTLRGEFTHNFGFRGDVVYTTTNSGVYRSNDGGKTWIGFSRFTDAETRRVSADPTCYASAVLGERTWIANADGLMWTTDTDQEFFGTNWHFLRAAQAQQSTAEAYAYPNPFSPDDEVCRVHYRTDASGSVSIRIYDYAMLPVRTLIRNASRAADAEQDEIWDGRNDSGSRVANGVYYIEVTLGDADPVWTKIIVLQ